MLLDASQVPPRKCARKHLPTVGVMVGASCLYVCLPAVTYSCCIHPPAMATLLGSAVP